MYMLFIIITLFKGIKHDNKLSLHSTLPYFVTTELSSGAVSSNNCLTI